jgi:NhaC family Na+:H+ antiporter
MSPLSDTTNMAPAMVGTDLYTHIKHMFYTTGVSYALTLIIEIALGFFYGGGQANLESVNQILAGIEPQFTVNPLLLIPPVIIIVLAFKKIPAVPGIVIGILAAGILGIIFQRNDFGSLLSAAYGGYTSNSGIEAVDNLLTKGGFSSMMYTISLVICAMMYGGIMEKTNQLRAVVNVILKKAESTGSLITATILTAIGCNMILCDQYMSIVMTGKMYAQSYKDKGLHPKNLSRAVEDSATVTANLVPWNSGGAYQAATLGVPTILYLPFNFFCWITPIVSMLYGWFNITIDKDDESEEQGDEPMA